MSSLLDCTEQMNADLNEKILKPQVFYKINFHIWKSNWGKFILIFLTTTDQPQNLKNIMLNIVQFAQSQPNCFQ